MHPDSPACNALAARIGALYDPDASAYRIPHADAILIAAQWREELAEMRTGEVAGVDPFGLAVSA